MPLSLASRENSPTAKSKQAQPHQAKPSVNSTRRAQNLTKRPQAKSHHWYQHYLVVCFFICLLFTTIYNLAFWRHAGQIFDNSPELSLSFKLIVPWALLCLLYTLCVLLFSYKYIFKVAFCLLFLLTCEVSYNSWVYGVIFDRDMIQNIVNTNVAEAKSYTSWRSILVFIIGGILPCVILWKTKLYYPPFFKSMLQRIGTIVLFLAITLGLVLSHFQNFAFISRNNHSLRYEFQPIGYISAAQSWVRNTYFNEPLPYVNLTKNAVRNATPSDKPGVAFLVVGETARAANYSVLGYGRATNEWTQRERMIAFKNVMSCGTATAYSVPCMFSNLGRDDYSSAKAQSRDNILDIMQHVGIDVLWLDNDGGCQGVCKNIKTIDVSLEAKTNKQLCNGETCHDEIFLNYAQELLKNINKDTLVVFHIMGSHGPRYYERYPEKFRRYTPDCNRPDVENCTTEEVINAYDNTILYTDYVVYQLIEILEQYRDKYDTSLMYISDHGESLGENGLYLHGTPYALAPKEQTEIPWMFWIDDQTARRLNLDKECLAKENFHGQLSHDNLFHSLLGLMQIDTPEYLSDRDIFAKCMPRPFPVSKATQD